MRFVPVAADVEGGGQIAADARLSAGEAVVHGVECSAELVGDHGVAEGDQAVATPAGEVDCVQREVGQVLAARPVLDLFGGPVERAAAGSLLARSSGHLPFGCVQPCFDLVRDGCACLVMGGADHGQGVLIFTKIGQDVGLFPGGVRKQALIVGLAGGCGGSFIMLPGRAGLKFRLPARILNQVRVVRCIATDYALACA